MAISLDIADRLHRRPAVSTGYPDTPDLISASKYWKIRKQLPAVRVGRQQS